MNTQITSSKLLFKATRDGFSASSFHTKCDGKGATIVIVKATSGAIFGGYTSASWQSGSGSWVLDNSAFLFSLISSTKEERFVKLTFQNSQDYKNTNNPNYSNQYGIYNGINYGPTFGGGHDIYIADNSNVNMNSASKLCWSYCETTMSLNSDASKAYLAGSFTFQVEDYEVYSCKLQDVILQHC